MRDQLEGQWVTNWRQKNNDNIIIIIIITITITIITIIIIVIIILIIVIIIIIIIAYIHHLLYIGSLLCFQKMIFTKCIFSCFMDIIDWISIS